MDHGPQALLPLREEQGTDRRHQEQAGIVRPFILEYLRYRQIVAEADPRAQKRGEVLSGLDGIFVGKAVRVAENAHGLKLLRPGLDVLQIVRVAFQVGILRHDLFTGLQPQGVFRSLTPGGVGHDVIVGSLVKGDDRAQPRYLALLHDGVVHLRVRPEIAGEVRLQPEEEKTVQAHQRGEQEEEGLSKEDAAKLHLSPPPGMPCTHPPDCAH